MITYLTISKWSWRLQEQNFNIDEPDCSKYGDALNEIEDLENKKCSEFADEGFRCVPFYACKQGEVITNGRG